jgi:multiple antibiotic resistance protein
MPVLSSLRELLQTTVLVVAALFPIVNPLSGATIFLSITEGYSAASRGVLARKVALYGFALLLVSFVAGTHLLSFFGISLAAVQVGGGLVVLATGWALLNRPTEPREPHAHAKAATDRDLLRHAFYPLTLPLSVGPGSISVAITLGANLRKNSSGLGVAWDALLAAIVGLILISGSVWLCYYAAERMSRALGETGTNVVVRLSSFILVCIGVQILWNGLSALVRTLPALLR